MKKAIFILLTICFLCACGQKGPLVPPHTVVSGKLLTEVVMPAISKPLSSL